MPSLWRCNHCETVLGMVEQTSLTIHPLDCQFRVEGYGEVIRTCKKCATLNVLNLGKKSHAL